MPQAAPMPATRGAPVGDLVSWAYANGTAAGIGIDGEADDDSGSQLTSADGQWVVRYSRQDSYWRAVDADAVED